MVIFLVKLFCVDNSESCLVGKKQYPFRCVSAVFQLLKYISLDNFTKKY